MLSNIIETFNLKSFFVNILGSFITAFILSIIFGKLFLKKSHWFSSRIRGYVPDSHKFKNNTPTMGGLFIILSFVISVLFWNNLFDFNVWLFIFCIIGFGAIGFWDDVNKIFYKKGISESKKFLLQIIVALIISFLWCYFQNLHTSFYVQYLNFNLNFGYLIIGWASLVLIATSNAVNLTDGLDGLAISSLIINFFLFGMISYWFLFYYPYDDLINYSEIVLITSSLIGSSLGFLIFNIYPAKIFMGDVGSLSLGAVLGLLALILRLELLLIISGGIFVVETLSVIFQVFFYKKFSIRLFKMAPIHHHFEIIGFKEYWITIAFSILTLILCLLSFAIFMRLN